MGKAEIESVLRELQRFPIAFTPLYRYIMGSVTGGIVLSQLFHLSSRYHDDKFFHTDARLRAETTLTKNELRSVKVKLKKLPFLKLSQEGVPCKTYYQIKWDVYIPWISKFLETNDEWVAYREIHKQSFVESTEPGSEFNEEWSLNSLDSIKEQYKEQKEEESKGSAPSTSLESRYIKLAERLRDAISKTRKVNATSKVTSWATSLRSVVTTDGVDIKRLRKVLRWYCVAYQKYSREQYFPVAESGKSFREKFLKIEKAMPRPEWNDGVGNDEQVTDPTMGKPSAEFTGKVYLDGKRIK